MTVEDLELEEKPRHPLNSSPMGIREPIAQKMDYIFSLFRRGKIILQPEFQRYFVWGKKKQKEKN